MKKFHLTPHIIIKYVERAKQGRGGTGHLPFAIHPDILIAMSFVTGIPVVIGWRPTPVPRKKFCDMHRISNFEEIFNTFKRKTLEENRRVVH